MSLRLTVLALVSLSSVVLAAEPKPPPFITPYPGQKLYGDAFQVTDFDEHHFIVAKTTGQPPPGPEFKRVEGKITQFVYEHPAGRSSLEVFKNYEEGLKKAGFETIYTCAGKGCGSTVAPFPGWMPQLKQWVPDEKNRYLLAKLTRPTEGNIWVGFYINLVGLEVNGINYKVKKDRLKAAGVGPYVPVASNRNEQGRAKNRRVVLVEDVP